MAPEGSSAQGASVRPGGRSGMHHTSEQLQDMLRLARGCLVSGHLPGDPRPKDFFDRFDAQAAVHKKRNKSLAYDLLAEPIVPSRLLDSFGDDDDDEEDLSSSPSGLSLEARVNRLKRDAARFDRATMELKREIEVSGGELARAVLARARAEDGHRAAQEEARKARRAIREARKMQAMQEREIEELQALLAATPAAASRSAASTLRPSPSPAASARGTGEGSVFGGLSHAGSRRGAPSEAEMSPTATFAPAANPRTTALPLPGASVEAIRRDLLQAAPVEAAGRPAPGDDALVSALTALDELSRQLQPRPAAATDAASEPGGDAEGSAGEIDEDIVNGSEASEELPPPAPSQRPRVELMAPPKQKNYVSVMAGKPRSHKTYLW